MADCCEDKSCAIEALKKRQSGTLKIVLAINAVIFVVVFVAGLLAASTALMSDSLDNLGDAITYALSLYVISRTNRDKAKVALFKGGLILATGLFVLGQVIYRIFEPTVPVFETMGGIGILSLVANGICLALLWKHRGDDINMSSVWECSRNDVWEGFAVLAAAGGVWLFGSGWPDLVIGAFLLVLFARSATRVFRNAYSGLISSR